MLFLLSLNIFSANTTIDNYTPLISEEQFTDSLPVVIMTFAGSEKNPYFVDSLHYFESIDSAEGFMKYKNLSGPVESSLDTENYALLLAAYRGGDCLAKFEINLFDNPETKEYIFNVKVIYGGCRAGGKSYLNWFKIPKLPEGYKLKYHRYYVDREY